MQQLPIFVSIYGKTILLIGTGDAAQAKRQFIERAGGICISDEHADAMLAFIALEDREHAITARARLKARGLLVNVVDQPDLCDFTTPAVIDRDPVLIAVGTGGASAGLAKAIRQRFETMLPEKLGALARHIFNARPHIRNRWPDGAQRRRALDMAFAEGGDLDPFCDQEDSAVTHWLEGDTQNADTGIILIEITSSDPDDLTLRHARLLGMADHIYCDGPIAPEIINRARADAKRSQGAPTGNEAGGLILHLYSKSID